MQLQTFGIAVFGVIEDSPIGNPWRYGDEGTWRRTADGQIEVNLSGKIMMFQFERGILFGSLKQMDEYIFASQIGDVYR